MPVNLYQSGGKCYAQWGRHGAKYYYACGSESGKKKAQKKAEKQGAAAYANGYKG